MSHLSQLRSFLLAGAALAVVAGCSDSNISSPGEGQLVPAPGPGTGGGGGGGGNPITVNLRPNGGCAGGVLVDGEIVSADGLTTILGCDVVLAGDTITSDLTLDTSSPTAYFFPGATFVGTDDGPTGGAGTPVTLTAEPGAILVFENPTDFLTVNRGSQFVANGSAVDPIVLTSDEDLLDDGVPNNSQGNARGQWGGLVINGQAPINNCANPAVPASCETAGEGGTGLYGGDNGNDSSGTLNYVRVQYAGFEITTDNELNGIAFQGVGDGTNVDFLQVHNNDDDGVEFFGGTVDVRHVVVTGVDDDAVDWVAGWSGSAQDVIVIGSGVGDNGFEGDNNSSNNDVTPRSMPKFSNFTLVGGATEDLGMQLREGTAGMFVNGIVANWDDACLDVDNEATFNQIGTGLTIANTYFSCATLFNNDGAVEDDESTSDDDSADAANFPLNASTFPGISSGASTLSGVLPGVNEQAVSAASPTSIDPNFDGSETFIGAIAPGLSAAQAWPAGWTVPNSVFAAECPDNTTDITDTSTITTTARNTLTSGGRVCELTGTITSDTTLAQGNLYRLNGAVFIGQDQGPDAGSPSGNAATLTVQAGVVVYGEQPTDFLVISRGSQLEAPGLASAPIVFTSDEDINEDGSVNNGDRSDRGEWGGLIINGNAPINNCANPAAPASCSASGEGGTGNYGGNDGADDSGRLNYVRVQYAGFEITTDNELNGIAFQGVGTGTEIDFVQVHNNDDDGIEFFGGTADAKHLVITGVDDDGLDWVAGWKGSAQFVLIDGSGVGDNGFEGDNNSSNNAVTPRSNPLISNFTLLGGATEDLGMQIREGTGGLFINGVVADWDDDCLDVDDAETFNIIDAGAPDVDSNGVNDDDLQIDTVFFSCTSPFNDDGAVEDDASMSDDDAADALAFPLNATTFPGITTVGVSSETGVDFGSDVVAPIDPTAFDTFFDTVTVIGANGEEDDWFDGWTVSNSFGN